MLLGCFTYLSNYTQILTKLNEERKIYTEKFRLIAGAIATKIIGSTDLLVKLIITDR